jgi:hypothetical protein
MADEGAKLMDTIEIQDSKYQADMESLYDALAGSGHASDAATIVEDEARLLLKQVLSFTPPKNKAQGEHAVQSDLARIFSPVEDDFAAYVANGGYRAGASTGNENVDLWLHNAKGSYEVNWEKLDPSGSGMAAFHKANRNRKGRTSGKPSRKIGGKWQARYVVGRTGFDAYLKKVQARVGQLKSGWLKAYTAAGGKVPGWISRHAAASLGGVVNNLAVPGKPSITMSNHAAGVLNIETVVRNALRARTGAMTKRLRLVLSGYNKDLAQNIRPRKHAVKTSGSDSFAE